MLVRCDLHIHTDLSPCAEAEMTPGNIIGMAMLKGLQVIAITDHQSCGNCGPAMALAEKIGGPLVIPGLEVESAEEIHLLCLLPSLEAAAALERLVRRSMPDRANRPDIFGDQHLFNDRDEITGVESRLLLQACALSIDDIARQVLDLGGACLPAHIDREANSLLLTFGSVPPDFPGRWLELSSDADERALTRLHPELAGYRLLRNSDAHRLADIAEPGWLLEVEHFRPGEDGRQKMIQALRP